MMPLNQTYQNNIQLNAERENIKASEEDINISKADFKPSLTISGSKSFENTNTLKNQNGGTATKNDVDPVHYINKVRTNNIRLW
jgi:outer membrane protein